MSWSPDLRLLATGGNDNLVFLWDPRLPSHPSLAFREHSSAVKALSWCPWHSGVVASGGGSMERTIRVWSAVTGKRMNAVDSGSQVREGVIRVIGVIVIKVIGVNIKKVVKKN